MKRVLFTLMAFLLSASVYAQSNNRISGGVNSQTFSAYKAQMILSTGTSEALIKVSTKNIESNYAQTMSSFATVDTNIASILLQSSGVPMAVFNASMTIVDTNFGARTLQSVFIDSMTRVDANFNNYTLKTVFLASMTAVDNNYTPKTVFLASMTAVDNNYTPKSVHNSSMTSIEANYTTTLSSFNKIDGQIVDKASIQTISGQKTFTSSLTVTANIECTDVFVTSFTGIHVYSIDRGSVTAFNTADGYELIAGTTVVKYAGWFEVSATGVIKYVGKKSRVFSIIASINGRCTNSNDIHCIKLYYGANEIPCTYVRRLFTNTATDYGQIGTITSQLLSTNDTISAKIANQNATNGFNLFNYSILIEPTR